MPAVAALSGRFAAEQRRRVVGPTAACSTAENSDADRVGQIPSEHRGILRKRVSTLPSTAQATLHARQDLNRPPFVRPPGGAECRRAGRWAAEHRWLLKRSAGGSSATPSGPGSMMCSESLRGSIRVAPWRLRNSSSTCRSGSGVRHGEHVRPTVRARPHAAWPQRACSRSSLTQCASPWLSTRPRTMDGVRSSRA